MLIMWSYGLGSREQVQTVQWRGLAIAAPLVFPHSPSRLLRVANRASALLAELSAAL